MRQVICDRCRATHSAEGPPEGWQSEALTVGDARRAYERQWSDLCPSCASEFTQGMQSLDIEFAMKRDAYTKRFLSQDLTEAKVRLMEVDARLCPYCKHPANSSMCQRQHP